jgi:hypothetical protein
MKWQRNGNFIQDEDGQTVVILPISPNEAYIQSILKLPKIISLMQEYIRETDRGSLPAKRMYNKFKSVVEEIQEVA